MTVWENFVSTILTTYKKEDLICQYYSHLYGGNKGIKCSKLCPFRQFGGQCMLYTENGNKRVNREAIEEILNSEVN